MIIKHEETLISSEIFSTQFVCNLSACRGACCIEGDRGAPIEKKEIQLIENNLEQIRPYMSLKGIQLLESEGFYEGEEIDDLVTTCLPTGECVFVYKENAILGCAIEKSFRSGKSNFYKPISCHLYPIRIGKIDTFESLNYHKWDICKAACALGKELNVPVFEFLRDALVRKFGEPWFRELQIIYEEFLLSTKTKKGDIHK